jgi:hypothetical protein
MKTIGAADLDLHEFAFILVGWIWIPWTSFLEA